MLAKLDYAIVAMTEVEARTKVNSINANLEDIRKDLLELYEREGWRALGYSNWNECVQAEFHLGRTRVYQLLDAARVEKNIFASSLSTIVDKEDIPESNLRPLVSLPAKQQCEVWTKAVETAPNGKVTAAHVQDVVNDYKRPVSYHISDDSYEWFTPAEYIDAARAVMGGIDLDPASCTEANKIIKAKRFYTKQDSGLDHKWSGCVWLNPPYNMPLIEDFANKAIESYKSGAVEQAIVLTNNSTDTGWFHALAEYPFCLTRGRVGFTQSNGDKLATRQGQAIFYLGKSVKKFITAFSIFGIVVVKYEHCKS